MDAPMNPNMPRQSSGGTGFVIATVILLAIILVGVLYFWKARSEKMMPAANDAGVSQIENQSSSDDTASIESDLNATDVNSVDYDLNPDNFTSS